MARVILAHNIGAVNEDGSIEPTAGELARNDETAHVAFALGEFYRATQETRIGQTDIVALVARCVAAQLRIAPDSERGLAYAALGLLSFGPSKDRNAPWALLDPATQEQMDKRLLVRTDYNDRRQAFNIGKSVTRFSLGLSKRDETARLVERFVERIKTNSSGGFCDDFPRASETPTALGGCFDLQGIMQYVFIRQSLQLHSNIHLRERKLPTLRTYAEKYLKLLPDVVRSDGLGWCFGSETGAYGQMHLISLILQSMRDGWIAPDKMPLYRDILRRLFLFFFMTYIDQEQGVLVIRDGERDTDEANTSRAANFDAARYLCQWFRLAKTVGGTLGEPVPATVPAKPSCRFISFDRTSRKEQGLCVYRNPENGLHVQIPLVSGGARGNSDSLAFPHMPGVFDAPVGRCVPVFLPEWTIGENTFTPSFYGKNISVGLGMRNAFTFSYEQPELITKDEKIVPGVGSCRVKWEFLGGKMTLSCTLQVRQAVRLSSMRFVMPIAAAHSRFHLPTSFRLGEKSFGCTVPKDDFQGAWLDYENVSEDSSQRTRYGKIYYYQTFVRAIPLRLRPGTPYRLDISFEPDIATIAG